MNDMRKQPGRPLQWMQQKASLAMTWEHCKMGSMTASQFGALAGLWELNRTEETARRSSQQTPALSRTSPEELTMVNCEEVGQVACIKLNQNTTRNSDSSETELLSVYNCHILFRVIYEDRLAPVQSKKSLSQLQDPVRFISSAVKSSEPACFPLSSVAPKPPVFLNCPQGFLKASMNFSISPFPVSKLHRD